MCLVTTTFGSRDGVWLATVFRGHVGGHQRTTLIGNQYDSLCARFGIARVNAALRSRILSNMARRTLLGRAEGHRSMNPVEEGEP